MSASSLPSALVVGAGLAGLTTASRLQAAGSSVTVLEAGNRVGGRMCSTGEGFADGQVADLGAEIVDASYRAVAQLCAALDVELSSPVSFLRPDAHRGETPLENYLAPGRIVVAGEILGDDAFAAADAEIREAIRQTPPVLREILEQWGRRARLTAPARAVMKAITRMPTQLDEWEMDGHYAFHAYLGPVRRIVGGSQRLPEALARGLDIRLESLVVTIRQGGGKVSVETATGETFTADRVVVAVPPFVLPSIGFSPPLPDAKIAAIVALRAGRGGKVIAQYRDGDAVRAALTSPCYSDGPINAAWVSNPEVADGPAIVSGFVCGTDRTLLEDEVAAPRALDELVATMVGAPVERMTHAAKDWTGDPLTLGVTVTPAKGQRGAGVAIAALPYLRVHFAGDYTDDPLCGTMEGAARSGERAAAEVLRRPVRLPLAEIERMVRS
jgi:monoamine oxidase